MSKLSYTRAEAAVATGLSEAVIRRAEKSGDLRVVYPTVGGVKLTKGVIPADELARWVGAA